MKTCVDALPVQTSSLSDSGYDDSITFIYQFIILFVPPRRLVMADNGSVPIWP